MATFYYKKNKKNFKKLLRLCSLGLILSGFLLLFYVSFPFLSWQLYFAPVFAQSDITAPIPKTTIVTSATLGSLLTEATNTLTGVDYSDAQNWFPNYKAHASSTGITSYLLSIPKINVNNAVVTTVDYNLSSHLVNYGGTSVPPNLGNAVVFGHSTLPQLFDPKNYKTIFANVYTLKTGDEIRVTIADILYTYKIFSMTVVEPTDTSIFSQGFGGSVITLVTCTPPGTTWKRLVVRAKLEQL